MSMLFCDNCGDLKDSDFVELHDIDFYDERLKSLDGNWCADCVSNYIPNDVKIKIDGSTVIYRDGMLYELN